MENHENILLGRLLQNARHLRGISMDELCRLTDNCVTKQTISNYERGRTMPGRAFLRIIQKALNLPPSYFSVPQTELAEVELRYRGDYTAKRYVQLKAGIQTAMSRYLRLETALGLIVQYTNPIPDLVIRCHDDMEVASDHLRDVWHLGDSALPYLCSQLEYRGIRIVEVSIDDDSFDGMSGIITHLNQPFIAVSEQATPERRRFTLLHELGHILLVIGDEADDKEKVCNYFAGAMLFPRKAAVYELGNHRTTLSMQELISIKERYGISIAAIVHRAYDLGIIDRRYYDHLYDDCINHNRMETGWGEYRIPDGPQRYRQMQARAVSEDIIVGENENMEITIL